MAGRTEARGDEDTGDAVTDPVAVQIDALSQSVDGEENCVQPAPSSAATRRPTALALVTAAPSSPVATSRGASRDAKGTPPPLRFRASA